jgi:3-hydroxyacyl-CoA dehydrogenase-like protein
MKSNKPIRRVAIIGTGVIGASWTALFLAKGLKVVATDVAPNAEAALRQFVKAAWPALERLGVAPGASQANLTFTADLPAAVKDAEFVQENGPERIDFKKKLYAQLDELLPADVIVASSSSGLTMSEIQSTCRLHPERCVIGHPFNPPHLVPLVEIVGGAKTSDATIERAADFYTGLGKQTRPCGQPSAGGLGAGGLLPRRRRCCQRCRRRHRVVLGARPALGHHGQYDAQPPRRRPRRHRALLPAVHRPYDGLVEGSRAASIDARSAKEAHRQRSCRGRLALDC